MESRNQDQQRGNDSEAHHDLEPESFRDAIARLHIAEARVRFLEMNVQHWIKENREYTITTLNDFDELQAILDHE